MYNHILILPLTGFPPQLIHSIMIVRVYSLMFPPHLSTRPLAPIVSPLNVTPNFSLKNLEYEPRHHIYDPLPKAVWSTSCSSISYELNKSLVSHPTSFIRKEYAWLIAFVRVNRTRQSKWGLTPEVDGYKLLWSRWCSNYETSIC